MPAPVRTALGYAMKRILFCLTLLILVIASPGAGQTPSSDPWVDTIGGEYEVLPNITYATANGTELKLDLYLPRDRSTPVPTLVFYHGGGWVEGLKEQNVFHFLPYIALGWGVVNVEYRLGRNSPAPAAVEDCRCALRWVHEHAKQYGLDKEKIVLTGGSAGGHLALITGMLPFQTPFDRQCPTDNRTRWTDGTEPPMKVAAIVNWFGITDVAQLLDGPDAKHYAIEWFGSRKDREDLARELSPLTYARSGTPPVITIHGDRDNIVPYSQAVRLHASLTKAGVPNRLLTIAGAGHGGFTREQLAQSFAAIREFLRSQGVLKAQ
jgi:acetyl esterase/lipase